MSTTEMNRIVDEKEKNDVYIERETQTDYFWECLLILYHAIVSLTKGLVS